MRTLVIAAVLTSLAAPAYAQFGGNPLNQARAPKPTETEEQKKANEQAYKSATGVVPTQKPNTDPWGSVRAADQPQDGKSKAAGAK